MNSIGFDSCFFDRLDSFSKSVNHVLLSTKGKSAIASDSDWQLTMDLVQTLSAQVRPSLAASSIAACLMPRFDPNTQEWDNVVKAVAARNLDKKSQAQLYKLALSLDEERTAVMARMRAAHV